jgi:hypothetical protein
VQSKEGEEEEEEVYDILYIIVCCTWIGIRLVCQGRDKGRSGMAKR